MTRRAPVVAAVMLAAVAGLAGCGDDRPPAEAAPKWPTFDTAAELLDAAEQAGLHVCPKPKVPLNASRAVDQLSCWLSFDRYVAARIYYDEAALWDDIDGQREVAKYDLRDGLVPSSLLVGPSENGRPFWMLIGPLDQLRAVAEKFGGRVANMSLPPAEQFAS